MSTCDVLVAGAGLAGLVAATRLAEGGWKVVLVDAKPAVDRKVHTTGIFVRRTLEDFSPPEDCLGPGIRRVVLHSPAGREIRLVADAEEFRIGRMGRLYSAILERARAAGADYRPGTRYVGSEGRDGGSMVSLRTPEHLEHVHARVIVGADGSSSSVAADLELDRNREWIVGVEDVLEGSLQPDEPELHCFLDPCLAPGYIAWLADDGESVHVGVGGRPGRFQPAAALNRLRARLRAEPCFAAIEGLRRIERRGGRIPVGGILERIGCARGLLIGDAAGAVSPLTAGGLDPCYRLTHVATSLVARVLGGAPLELIQGYSGRPYRRHFRKRRWSRRVLEAVGHPLLAELACGVLRTPAGRSLARRVFFGRGSFPDVDPAGLLPARADGGSLSLPVGTASPAG